VEALVADAQKKVKSALTTLDKKLKKSTLEEDGMKAQVS